MFLDVDDIFNPEERQISNDPSQQRNLIRRPVDWWAIGPGVR